MHNHLSIHSVVGYGPYPQPLPVLELAARADAFLDACRLGYSYMYY